MNIPKERLPAPDLPQMSTEMTITRKDIQSGGGVFIRVMEYHNAKVGDFLKILWDGVPVKEIIINEIASDFPVITTVTDEINVGLHQVVYQVEDIAKNLNVSQPVNVELLSGGGKDTYPAPVFRNAQNGFIKKSDISKNQGVYIDVRPYSGIQVGDAVILLWRCYNATGKEIESSVENHTVISDDVGKGMAFFILHDKYNMLNDQYISAYYKVKRNNTVLGISKESQVQIKEETHTDGLQLCVSTGAAVTDYEAIHVHPYNQGVVSGPPGTTVVLQMSGKALFNETMSTTYETNLNEEGLAYFKAMATKNGLVEISSYKKRNPGDNSGLVSCYFSNYVTGNDKIPYVNYTTRAPANGKTPCSLYIKTATLPAMITGQELSVIRVNVSGSAEIVGYPGCRTADIHLHTDKSAEIDIINIVAEEVVVTISLPESSGSVIRRELSFIEVKN